MIKSVIAGLLAFSFMNAALAVASVHEGWAGAREQFRTYKVSSGEHALVFRFSTPAEIGPCEKEPNLWVHLIKVDDRVAPYFVVDSKVLPGADNGFCEPGAPVITISTSVNAKSEWFTLPANQTSFIITPEDVELELFQYPPKD